MSELHLSAGTVPTSDRHDLVTVDGRSFAISGETGDMVGRDPRPGLRRPAPPEPAADDRHRRPGRAAGRQHAHPVVRRRRLAGRHDRRRRPTPAGDAAEPCGATSPRSW